MFFLFSTFHTSKICKKWKLYTCNIKLYPAWPQKSPVLNKLPDFPLSGEHIGTVEDFGRTIATPSTSQLYCQSLTGWGEVFCFIGSNSFAWMINEGLILFLGLCFKHFWRLTISYWESLNKIRNSNSGLIMFPRYLCS